MFGQALAHGRGGVRRSVHPLRGGRQGLTLVNLSAQPEHCLWDTVGVLGGYIDKDATG